MSDNSDLNDRIRRETNTVALVSSYGIQLRRAGKRYVGLCPFHREKTGSFSVDPDTGRWYCFGCSDHGDAFSFLQRIEGITFPQARRMLADHAGISLIDPAKSPADRAAAARQRAYAEQLAEETGWWWRYLRRRYVRLENDCYDIERRAAAWLESRLDQDTPATEWAWFWLKYSDRFALHWGTMIDLIDAASPEELVRWYSAIRNSATMRICREEMRLDSEVNEAIEKAWGLR